MRALRRTVYFAAIAALLGSGLAACSSGKGAQGAASTTPGLSAQRSSARAVAAVSRNVSFAVGGTTTDATLDIPAHRSGQRLAAALLLAGSGPTDRNGNDIAANLAPYILQLIAGELARTGIMSLEVIGRVGLADVRGQVDEGRVGGEGAAAGLAAEILVEPRRDEPPDQRASSSRSSSPSRIATAEGPRCAITRSYQLASRISGGGH